MNLIELADHLAKGFFPAILHFTIVLGLIMAEKNIEVRPYQFNFLLHGSGGSIFWKLEK